MCIYCLPIICKIKNNWNAKFLSMSLITTKNTSLSIVFIIILQIITARLDSFMKIHYLKNQNI